MFCLTPKLLSSWCELRLEAGRPVRGMLHGASETGLRVRFESGGVGKR